MRRERKARALCAACPVAPECRSYGRAHHEYGMWGGESEVERDRAGFHIPLPVGGRQAS